MSSPQTDAFWAYPTSTARTIHWFPGEQEVSGCRRYFSGALALMSLVPTEAKTWSQVCARCETAEAKATR